jgi:hypothetical protein
MKFTNIFSENENRQDVKNNFEGAPFDNESTEGKT